MSRRPFRRRSIALAASLTLTLSAAQALATQDTPATLFPAPPTRSATGLPAQVTPPVLRVRPLIELRWAEIFSDRAGEVQEMLDAGRNSPPVRLPSGPMYRRDI